MKTIIAAVAIVILSTGCASTPQTAKVATTKAEHCTASANFIAARQRMAQSGIGQQDDQRKNLFNQCMASL